MTAKEYLKMAERIDLLIRSKEDELYILRKKIMQPSQSDLNIEKVDGSFKVDQLSSIIAKIISYENYINQSICEMYSLHRDISDKIDLLSSGDYKTVLRLRYLNLKGWEQICIEMNYSYSHTLLIHRKALEEFERIHKDFLVNKNSRK